MIFLFWIGVVAFVLGLLAPNEGLVGMGAAALCGCGGLVAGFCGFCLLL